MRSEAIGQSKRFIKLDKYLVSCYSEKVVSQEIQMICKLKELMKEAGVNQFQLSKATGLSPTTVGNLYRNRFTRVDVTTLETLCKHFGVGVERILEATFDDDDA